MARRLDPVARHLVDALASPTCYPGDPSAWDGIEHIQTHLSHLFLTRDRVYKLRKPVSFDFVDFASRPARLRDCLEEVRLNRRLAPDVYLGVAPVVDDPDGVHVGVPREPAEWEGDPAEGEVVTVMRRLPEDRDALSLLRGGALTAPQLETVARRLVDFHARHRLPTPAAGHWRSVCDPVWAAFDSFKDTPRPDDAALLRRLEWRLREFESLHGYRLARRWREGLRVDGHGDLHLQHLWFDDDAEPRVIDCLEFDTALREIDPACDLAFLTMDLRYRGRGDLAESVLSTYVEVGDDYDLYGVLRYYESYRALVRAKVAHLATRDAAIPRVQRDAAEQSCRDHLELADRLLEESRPGALLVTSGWIGTGKSSVARELCRSLGAVRIATDVVRKHLSGVAPDTSLRSDWDGGAYTADRRRAVYDALRPRARAALGAGRDVVLDATFASREDRDALRAWAEAEGLRPWLVETACDDEVVAARLAARQRDGREASDAGPELLAASRAAYETPAEWPETRRTRIDTGAASWTTEVADLARRVAAARFG